MTLPSTLPGTDLQRLVLLVGLTALFLGLTALVAFALGLMTRHQRPEEQTRRRLSPYTLAGRQPKPVPEPDHRGLLPDTAVARSAVELAGRVMERRGLDTRVSSRLEAAGLPLRTGEWMLLHLGTTIGTGMLFLLLSGGGLLAAPLGLLLGLAGPWLFLSLRRDRRRRRFLSQLPDALQLLASSLQAGYSLPQAIGTVVREGEPPVSTEFNRAMVETRLGLPLEDALTGVAERLSSRDFSWVVMAVRIQREVGGNLAELLNTVAETLRERDRLRRQVQTLSAEGRLSGWILGALPLVFAVYLTLVRPEYLRPLLTTPAGWVLLGFAAVLLASGIFWVSRVVRVEV